MLRLAIAQFRPRKGAYAENLARLGRGVSRVCRAAGAARPLVLPEAALTGYFLEGGVQELARTRRAALRRPGAGCTRSPGAAVRHRDRLLRALADPAAQLRAGGDAGRAATPGIRHVHRKIFLPTYGVFDEERFVEPGDSVAAFDTALGPGGGASSARTPGTRWCRPSRRSTARSCCWWSSASPARGLLRPRWRRRWPAGQPAPLGADRPGHRGGARDVRGGGAAGRIRGRQGISGRVARGRPARARCWRGRRCSRRRAHGSTIDLDEIPRVRAEYPLLSDLREPAAAPARTSLAARRGRAGARTPGVTQAPRRRAGRPAARRRVAPPGVRIDPLAIDPELTRRWLVEFLRDEVLRRRGFDQGGGRRSPAGWTARWWPSSPRRRWARRTCTALRMPYRLSSPESSPTRSW